MLSEDVTQHGGHAKPCGKNWLASAAAGTHTNRCLETECQPDDGS